MIKSVQMRKAAVAIALVFAIIVTFSFVGELGLSYFRRYQASKLLAMVRQFHPGSTTEAQARHALKPFAGYETELNSGGSDTAEFAIENARPFPWTLFSVRIDFASGLVSRIHLFEMQVDHAGYPHPNSASVIIYSDRFQPPPPDFGGYSDFSSSTRGVDSQGKWADFQCCHARSIKLDERATQTQLRGALNFRLSCMTSYVRCKNDRQILP